MIKSFLLTSLKLPIRSRGIMVFEKLAAKIKRLSLSSSCSENESVCSSESSSSSSDEPKDPRDIIVQKPEDYSDCRVLTLTNGLKCLLVSDGDQDESAESVLSEKSAVGLVVKAGSAQEPTDIPGLAHLLEHVLFMGCKKYPSENEYDNFLSKHGGSSNASTDYESTTYLFDVSTQYFEGALDRFAHQFICPLLNKSSVKREVEAVDSEYMEGLQSDTQKLESILISLIQSDHPFNRFTTGNMETLLEKHVKDGNISQELRKFYEQFYSASCMCLCVISPEPLDKLEKMVQVFEQIPNKKTLSLSLEDYPLPVTRCNFVKYYPVKDRTKLTMIWFLKPQQKHYLTKPGDYVAWCIGHEGKGSLLSALKSKEYAINIDSGSSSGGFDDSSNFTRFDIEIQLSKKGFEMYKDVVTMVFQYIQMLKRKLPCPRIFDEMKKIQDVDFDNLETVDPYDRVEELAENMALYPPEHYLSGPELLFKYSPGLITEVTNSLTPQEVLVVLQNKSFKDECTETEKWYKGRFSQGFLENDFINILMEVSPGDFKLPEANPYIPEDFELKEVETEGGLSAPVYISDEARHKVWFQKDDVFEQPECFIYFHLFSKRVGFDLKSFALNSLYTVLLENRVAETFYPAKLAGLEAEIVVQKDGWHLKFNGYNDKMFKFFRKFICEVFDSNENTFNFTAVKDSTVKSVRISDIKPNHYATELRKELIYHEYYTSSDLANSIDALTELEVERHKAKETGPFFLESLGGGNITQEEMKKYVKFMEKKLKLDDENVLPYIQFLQPRVYKFPLGRYLYKRQNNNLEDVNGVVVNYYQHDAVNFRDTVILGVIEGLMEEPSFNQLRTRLQLGYSVSVDNHESNGVTGFSLTICSQASKFTSSEVNVYIERFLRWFEDYLDDMDVVSFKFRLKEFIKAKLLPNNTIDDDMDQIWQEVVSQEYIFDRDQRMADIMKKLTKEEVLNFYRNMFFENVRKVSVQVEGNPNGTSFSSSDDKKNAENGVEPDSSVHSVASESSGIPNMRPLYKDEMNELLEDLSVIHSVSSFHAKCLILPVYRMTTQVVTTDVTNWCSKRPVSL